MKDKTLSLKISPLLMDKLKYISKYNGTSRTAEIIKLIDSHISNFEKQKGEITQKDIQNSNFE